MKKIISIIVLAIMALCCSKKDASAEIYICICKVIEHEALNSVVSGIEDYLKLKNKKCKISVETSQGNMALASQIVAKFASTGADVVVTIGTSPSQCAFKLAKEGKIKLVFSSVTNPEDISPQLSGANTTGVSNFVDPLPQIKLFQKIQPSLKSLGIIYNTGEANSVSMVKKLRSICQANGLELKEQGISKISDIPQATNKLLRTVDAIFISNDNLALSGIANIVSICNRRKVPVYVSDTDQVEKGCLASLGPNQYDIGLQTGEIIERIVDGEDINKIAVVYPKTSELFINLKAARILNMTIPKDIVVSAKKVISD